jgi:hypothetical protein
MILPGIESSEEGPRGRLVDILRRNADRGVSTGDPKRPTSPRRAMQELRTTIVNVTTKESRTPCRSGGSRKHAGRGLCDVANCSAGSYVITIRTPLELAGRFGGRS